MTKTRNRTILICLLLAWILVFLCAAPKLAITASAAAKQSTSTLVKSTPTIKSVSPVSVTVKQNSRYKLPATLAVTLSDNSKKNLPVKWTSKNPYADTTQTGTIYYNGKISSGSYNKYVRLAVKVIPYIVSVDNLNAAINQYDSYSLPQNTAAIWSDGSKGTVSIEWVDSLKDTETSGSLVLRGNVSGFPSYVTLNLEILPMTVVSTSAENGSLLVVLSNAPRTSPSIDDFNLICTKLSPVQENTPLHITAIAAYQGDTTGTKFRLTFDKLSQGFAESTYQLGVAYKTGSPVAANNLTIPMISSSSTTAATFDPKITDSKQFYKAIKYAFDNCLETVNLEIKDYSENVYNLDMIDKVIYENPEIDYSYYLCSSKIGRDAQDGYTSYILTLKYKLSVEKMREERKAAESKAAEIVSKLIAPGMTDYQKELALHDYVVDFAKYDKLALSGKEPIESHNSYGVLVLGTGVCESYAKAMALLFDTAGLENKYVIGDAIDESGPIGHAWNMVRLDGEWYHVDATWDDPDISDGSSRIMHDYFNLTDKMISIDHKEDESLIDFPDCTGTKYYFFNIKSTSLDSNGNAMFYVSSMDELISKLTEAVSARRAYASFVLLNSTSRNYDTHSALSATADRTTSFRAGISESRSPIDPDITYLEIHLTY